MKGIFILSHHKTPGGFVDREFPPGICDQSGFGPDEENRIYFFNRMRDSKPNYVFVKVKGQQIGSYFSGLDPVICTGSPNKCICVIFEFGENPIIWEEGIRQIALELLPVLARIRAEDDPISQGLSKDLKYREFDHLLAKNFRALQHGDPISATPSISTPVQDLVESINETSSSKLQSQTQPSQQYLEVSITENKAQSFEAALKSAPTISDTDSHDLQQKLSSLAQDNGNLREQKAKTNILSASLQSAIEPLESQLKQAQEQISEESIDKINLLSAQLTEANQKAKEMWVSLSQRQAQTKLKDQEIASLNAEMAKLKENLQVAQEENSTPQVPARIHAEIDDLRSQLLSAKTQILVQKEKILTAQEIVQTAENPSKFREEIDNLRSQLITAKAHNWELKEQMQKAQETITSSEIPSRIHNEIEDLRAQLITAKKTIKVQRRDIVNLQNLLNLS